MYANKIAKAIGAYFIEFIPLFRSVILFFVSFMRRSDDPTVRM